ncbi:MAG TPA: aminopeptidase N, partial [Pseudomonas sp.]|nr:aminopeptidase N [Pseudomonas sp.]
MRTEQPKVIHLKDYQAPEYLIDETHLTFELYEDRTLVHAQLVMRRNPERPVGKLPPLELHGQELELLSIALNDCALGAGDYQLSEDCLTLQPDSDSFVIDTSVVIHPETNTALEGLYKSGSMFCTQC